MIIEKYMEFANWVYSQIVIPGIGAILGSYAKVFSHSHSLVEFVVNLATATLISIPIVAIILTGVGILFIPVFILLFFVGAAFSGDSTTSSSNCGTSSSSGLDLDYEGDFDMDVDCGSDGGSCAL